jgi:hypothetical protein
MDARAFEMGAAPPIIAKVRVAAVDDGVSALEVGCEFVDDLVCDCGRHHDPGIPRRFKLRGKILERACADGALGSELLYCFGVRVEDDALVTMFNEPPDHIGAHPAETDHSELHDEWGFPGAEFEGLPLPGQQDSTERFYRRSIRAICCACSEA